MAGNTNNSFDLSDELEDDQAAPVDDHANDVNNNHTMLTTSGIAGGDESEFVHLSCNHFDSDPEYNEIVKMVEFAIDHSVLPQRIYEGSSGSYFCKNVDNVT